jgi:hypothetical protein
MRSDAPEVKMPIPVVFDTSPIFVSHENSKSVTLTFTHAWPSAVTS